MAGLAVLWPLSLGQVVEFTPGVVEHTEVDAGLVVHPEGSCVILELPVGRLPALVRQQESLASFARLSVLYQLTEGFSVGLLVMTVFT